jgi:hypothetical protein
MSTILVILGRLFVILIGYVAASVAASAFLNLVTVGAIFPADELPTIVAGTFFTTLFVAPFVAYIAFVPSVVVILLAEFFGRRDWLTYALAGGVVGIVVLGFFWQAAGNMYDVADALTEAAQPLETRQQLTDPFVAMLMIGAGMVGGVAYWLVAGRMAGDWRRPTSPAR